MSDDGTVYSARQFRNTVRFALVFGVIAGAYFVWAFPLIYRLVCK